MPSVSEIGSKSRLTRQRNCVATFMDDNPAVFAAPEGSNSWVEFVQGGQTAEGRNRHVVDKALSMLVGVIRSAQISLNQGESIGQVFARARLSDIAEFEPDANALALAGVEEEPQELMAYAQSITIYKQCMDAGMITGDELPRFVEEALDRLPGTTPLMRSLIEAAKSIVQIDLDCVLAHE